MDKFKLVKSKDFNALPKTSGVYLFFAVPKPNGEGGLPTPITQHPAPIYIGKAINIKNRVKNHFQQPSYRDDLFIDKVDRIGYIETNSEIEALILEASLIKKYLPKFNVVWKDGKNYFYVAVTKDEKPIIYITHQKNESAEYIGPFVEGTALKKTLRFLRRAFPYYTTKKHPKNKCTYCHLDLCPGPLLFENPPSPEALTGLREYRRNIKKLILILKGKRSAVLNSLRKEMQFLSKENKFEEAGKIRDRISSLQQVMSHKSVINSSENMAGNFATAKNTATNLLQTTLNIEKISRIECYDISNTQGNQATGSMVVFTDGLADKTQYKKFRIKMENTPNDIAMLEEIIERRLLHEEWPYPEVMLIDGGIAQLNVAIKSKNQNIKTKDIKIISIAKKDKNLYIEGKDGFIPLKSLPQEIYNLILQLDDEAHRFAITYHKKLRKNYLLKK